MSVFSKHTSMKGVVLAPAEVVFYDAVADAETAWQYANKSTQALALAADLTKYRAIAAAANVAAQSGFTNLGGPAKQALDELTHQFA